MSLKFQGNHMPKLLGMHSWGDMPINMPHMKLFPSMMQLESQHTCDDISDDDTG